MHHSGKRHNLSLKWLMKMVQKIQPNPKKQQRICWRSWKHHIQLCTSTIKRVPHAHGLKGGCAMKKPILKGQNKKRQTDVWRWSAAFWRNVQMCQMKLEMLGHNKISATCGWKMVKLLIWRWPSYPVKHGGGSIMLCFAGEGTVPFEYRQHDE